MKNNGYIRVAAAVIDVAVANPDNNVESILATIKDGAYQGVKIIVFPELSITGYTCADLFNQTLLLEKGEEALLRLVDATKELDIICAIGIPLRHTGSLYNCAVFFHRGEIKCAIPKIYLPNSAEFYEKRWFASGKDIGYQNIKIGDRCVPFGNRILLRAGDAVIGAEICEDMWTPVPPASFLAMAGANIIVNLSASNEVISKHDYLRQLVSSESARLITGYVYASSGDGESSTDLVYSGNGFICENGKILAATERFNHHPQLLISDIDIELLENHRRKTTSWGDCAANFKESFTTIDCTGFNQESNGDIMREYSAQPFVPQKSEREKNCREIISIQVAGLMQRLRAINCKEAVIGISGGLDSTLALMVTVEAFDSLGLSRTGIKGITMPGFGTTRRTHTNADTLMSQLGITSIEIPISKAVELHFKDIGHNPEIQDVTYENCQARERTQILMDYANQTGGIVIGTGDLSESALGWATYNGDHMSMYAVNASIPKTLVKYLVETFAITSQDKKLARTLRDIIDTPISPELIPADDKGEIKQKTEELVGPYLQHDFFLYHTIRNGFGPSKIFMIAKEAFADRPKEEILKNLTNFYRRFFQQQFKRSCMPDSPKVGNVCLSPRGDWRMPSDASWALWKRECEDLANK